jgi:hypothetical protein
MPLERLSHSTVSSLGDCGEKVRLLKVAHVPAIPMWASVGGSAVHNATAALDLGDFGFTAEGYPNFPDAFRAEIELQEERTGIPQSEWRATGKATAANPDKEDRKWWEKKGPEFVENWRRFFLASPYIVAITPDGEPAVEIELNGTLGGAPVKGYLDRVFETPNGELLIVDLKTGVRWPKPKQLVTYRILLGQRFGLEWHPRWGFYFMNRSAQMTGPENLEALDDGSIEYEYQMAWTMTQNEVYLPNTTSGWCSTCEVKPYCYAVGGEKAHEVRPF